MFEIEKVPMPSRGSGFGHSYKDALKNLGVSDMSSFFISFSLEKNYQNLRASVHSCARGLGYRISVRSEYRYECKTHTNYVKNRATPQCNDCKLIDSGVRVWRVK